MRNSWPANATSSRHSPHRSSAELPSKAGIDCVTMAPLGRFDDRVESGVELVVVDLRERRPVKINERCPDLLAAVERLQSCAIERKLSDMGRARALGLFAQFEVDDQYTLAGCDKPIETAAIGQVRAPWPSQKSRQRDLGTGAGAKNMAQLRRADRRQDLGGERDA